MIGRRKDLMAPDKVTTREQPSKPRKKRSWDVWEAVMMGGFYTTCAATVLGHAGLVALCTESGDTFIRGTPAEQVEKKGIRALRHMRTKGFLIERLEADRGPLWKLTLQHVDAEFASEPGAVLVARTARYSLRRCRT